MEQLFSGRVLFPTHDNAEMSYAMMYEVSHPFHSLTFLNPWEYCSSKVYFPIQVGAASLWFVS